MTDVAAHPRVLDDVASERLATLYAQHQQTVRAVVGRSVRPGEVDDLVAAAFVEASSRLASDPRLPLGPGWLVTVARRRAVDLLRRDTRFRERVLVLAATDHDPGARLDEAVALRRDMAVALRTLSPRRRWAIELRYWHGCTVAEVGAILGTSTRAAESILARARADLLNVVGADGGD